MANLALLTVGVLKVPYYEPEIAPMGEVLDPVWAAAESGPGFRGFSTSSEPSYGYDWGSLMVPAMFQTLQDEMRLLTILSLWADLEAVYAFSYNGLHSMTLGRRGEWFLPKEAPGMVAWWVTDDHSPTWVEACTRYDKLHQLGPSADAFTFRQAFDADGQPAELDREAIKRIASHYQT